MKGISPTHAFAALKRRPARSIACVTSPASARLSTSSRSSLLGHSSRLRFGPSTDPLSVSLQRRHLSLWGSGASKGAATSSLPTEPSDAAPASSSTNGVWTDAPDPWSTQTATPSSLDALPSSSLNTLPPPVSEVVAPVVVPSVPINPLTNLPIDGNHIGDLADLGLNGWGPVSLTQTLLEQIHVNAGLPWWGTIVTVSVLTRVLLWPLLVKGMGRGARFFPIKEEVEAIMSRVKDASPEEQMRATLEARELMKRHDASPFGSMPPMLIQAAIVFTVFLALQGMAAIPVESLKTGGLAWIQNLTVPDPSYYLPGLATLVFLGSLETTEVPDDANAAKGKNIGRVLIIAGFFFLKAMPAGVVLYIGSNGVLQIIQGLALRVPAVRTRFRLPPVPKSLSKPSSKP